MSSERAEINASLTGAPKVVSGAKEITKALQDAKKAAGSDIQGAIDQTTGAVQVLGSRIDALRSAVNPSALLGGVLGGGAVSALTALMSHLDQAAEKYKHFGETTNQTSRLTQTDQDQLAAAYRSVTDATGVSADEQDAFIRAVNASGGSAKDAKKALYDIARTAVAEGRSMGDYVQSFVGLTRGMGDGAKEATDKIGSLIEQAKRLKVVGGPQELLDSMSQLGPILEEVSKKTPGATQRIEAFFRAAVAKGMSPRQALAATQEAVQFIRGNATGVASVKSTLGRDAKDEADRAIDPIRDIFDVQDKLHKRFGKGRGAESSEKATYGSGPLAAAMHHLSPEDVDREMRARDRNLTPERFRKQVATPEGAASLRKAHKDTRDLRTGKEVQQYYQAADQAYEDTLKGLGGLHLFGAERDAPRFGPQSAPTPIKSDFQNLTLAPESASEMGKAAGDRLFERLRQAPLKVELPSAPPNNQSGPF